MQETPLQWAASSDDHEVAAALIAGGADLAAAGSSIGGGTALDNAIAYGCWAVARLLVARGAPVTGLWQAAALGMRAQVAEMIAATPPPDATAISDACWHACMAGERRVVELLWAHGADLDHVPAHAKGACIDVAPGPDTRRGLLVVWLREHGASRMTNR
jgi:hypothetical protein